MVPALPLTARCIAGFGLISHDAERLTEFYVAAFGARHVSSDHFAGARFGNQMGVPAGARRHSLLLGREAIDIVQFDTPGRPYPRELTPDDTVFQHFAIVVSDMDVALARLQTTSGWTPISSGGPQRLPQSSGGVAAFKFRDPDGHPLEMLAFPEHAVPPHWSERGAQDIFLGIDHSAISVCATGISTAFYRSLGFTVTARTFNQGVEQANLDGMPDAQVEVTALSLSASTPHLELLCYRSGVRPPRPPSSGNDVAATRILLAVPGLKDDEATAPPLIVDPDGHRLQLVPAGVQAG